MGHALVLLLDAEADAAVRELWRRLDDAGVRSGAATGVPPHVTLAGAGAIPPRTRAALRAELALLSLPSMWLSTLCTFPTREHVLFLGAVVDTELLAVHSAAHDVLAGRVKQPEPYCLPGAWVPHCTLAHEITTAQLMTGFATLHPTPTIEARVSEVAIVDTRTYDVDVLRRLHT